MPVKDLTLQQLQMLKLNHVSEKDGNTKYDINEDHQPFPRLEVALQNLDEHTGFNIEVKYPLAYKDGKHEAEHYFERGEFVDQILKVVYKHAHNRRIIFSCFDPDSCAMYVIIASYLQLLMLKLLFASTGCVLSRINTRCPT